MCTHRESGGLGAGSNADCQMDRGGRRERLFGLVSCDVEAYVSCRRYVGISLSARVKP